MKNAFKNPDNGFLIHPAQKRRAGITRALYLVIITAMLFPLSIQTLNAQVQGDTTKLGKIIFTEQNNAWKIVQKAAAAPKPPLEMKDKSGKPVPPNQVIRLKSGRTVTAKEYFDELNKLEKNLNKYGYSIRDPRTGRVKFAIPKEQSLLNAQKSLTPSEGKFLTEAQRKQRNTPAIPVNKLVVKPVNEYSPQEFGEVRKKSLAVKANNLEMVASAEDLRATPGTLLKQFNHDKSKTWSYGTASIFKTELTARAKFSGKYYQPEGKEEDMDRDQIKAAIQNTNTEFGMMGTAKATGYVLGSSFQVLDARGEVYLPANKAKKAKVTVSAKLAGISVLNLNKEFSTDFNQSGKKSKQHKYSKEFNISILGYPISGEIGVKGEIGFEYQLKGTIPYTVSASCRPYAGLAAFAEASVDAWIVEAGVSANLNFIKGEVGIDGGAGIMVWNNVLVFANVDAVYKLEFLSGSLSVYVETPDICPFFDCSYRYDWDIWDWDGIQRTGTFLDVYSLNVYNW